MNVFGERQHPEKYIPMTIRNVRDDKLVTIHSDESRVTPGSRHYIHASDVADGCLFLLNNPNKVQELPNDFGGAKCPKFNLVGPVEWNNLELAQKIAKAQNKELKFRLVDFHSSRPGHDLRYALDGNLMKELGWEPDELEGVPDEANPVSSKIECFMQGTRDYIKFIKRGYTRISQNMSVELREGRISPKRAKELISEEGKKPPSLDVFLEYIGMSESEFNDNCESMAIPP